MLDKVLIYSRLPKSMTQRFSDRFDLLDTGGKPAHEVFPAEEVAQVRALITAGATPLGAEHMDRLPALGAIVCYGTGYDGVDLKAAAARNIAVGHSPGANAAAVADVAVMLMLASTRRLVVADAYVRDGGWAAAKPSPLMKPPPSLAGCKVGIYGMGAIGRKIAARVAAFEADIGYFNRTRYSELPYPYFPSLDALAEWCTVLMIAVRASAETTHVVNADLLEKLGPDGHIVNISRGSVIDQDALVAALKAGTIAGAGLDVFAREPHVPDELTTLPNVVVTPHIGGNTRESHVAMQACVIANLTAFFAGDKLPYAVSASSAGSQTA
ncbi:2-hydroxyacid dehydrogenase [Bradyrhizobium sp. STM 3809]|uniref:2-hydroxyacid dehydrogenase n=1 Tax=Bradyrhizobium sp. STM 3809 TaxID=551936 RepID=UPI000240975F|nr:2-hydroxyacid dehydrogenase [Bradyrhizobium sp. STM 3809]CCE00873.1 putative glyoxylate reductase (Glycolate reductase) [Bradyrhizobium sp. STM 3809]